MTTVPIAKPECHLTRHEKEAMTFWTVLSSVNHTLMKAGLPERAREFRIEAVQVYDACRHDEDNLADLYDIVPSYVEIR